MTTWKTLGEFNDTTLADLNRLAERYNPERVFIGYAGCGSHRITVDVLTDTPEPQAPQRPSQAARRPGEPF